MNNKGMTLVELIITFSLLMVIVVGMFSLILDIKIDLDNKQIAKNMTEYSDFLNNDIHYDLIRKKPFAIAIKQSTSSNWKCSYNSSYEYETNCSVNNSVLSVDVIQPSDDDEEEIVHITGSKEVDSMCNGYYPCAVYAYYNGTSTPSFKVIAFNNDKTKEGGCGVKYGNVIENMPDQKYADTTRMFVTMKIQNGYFKIEYPLYVVDDSFNYGFRIVYPFSVQ